MYMILAYEDSFIKGNLYYRNDERYYKIVDNIGCVWDGPTHYYICSLEEELSLEEIIAGGKLYYVKKIKIVSGPLKISNNILWDDAVFCDKAVEKNAACLNFVNCPTKSIMNKVVSKDIAKYTKNIVFELVKLDPYIITKYQIIHTRQIANYILKNVPNLLFKVECDDPEFLVEAVCFDPRLYLIYDIKDHLITKRILKKNPLVINYIKNPTYTHYYYIRNSRNAINLIPLHYYLAIILRSCC